MSDTKTSSDDRTKPRRSRLFRLARLLLKSVLFLLILLCIAVGIFDIVGNRRLAAVRKIASDKGLALSMADYFAKLPAIPDSENAALLYMDAFDELYAVEDQPASPYVPLVSRFLYKRDTTDGKLKKAIETYDRMGRDARTPLLDYMLEDSKVYLADRAAALATLHQASRLTKSRYPLDWQGPDTILPHLTKARASTRLLGVAAYVDAEEGRSADAASRIHDSLALARSLQREPLFISGLVENAIVAIITSNLQRVVSRTDLSDNDLLSLQKDCQSTLDTFSCRPAYEGELANMSDSYEDVLSGRLAIASFAPFVAPYAEGASFTWPPDRPRFGERILIVLSKGHFRTDEAVALRYVLRLLDNVDNPSPEFLAGPDPVLDEIKSSRFLLSRMVIQPLFEGVLQAEFTRARLRATVAGLAALRYRNDRGDWPDTLDALVPDYLDAIPIDPMTGKPLLYVVKPDGIIVYSVGANGIDDGDGYYASPPEGSERTGDDQGFRIWK